MLALACHRKGQGRRVPYYLHHYCLRAHCYQSLSRLSFNCCCCSLLLTRPHHQSSPPPHTAPRFAAPRAHVDSPLRPRRTTPNVVAWLRIRRDLHLLPLPLPPTAAQLLPPPTWILHTTRCKGRRAFGDCFPRTDFEELPLRYLSGAEDEKHPDDHHKQRPKTPRPER